MGGGAMGEGAMGGGNGRGQQEGDIVVVKTSD